MSKPIRLVLLTVCLGVAMNLAASPILTLNPPSGDISGAPGSTVGWGFTLTNDVGYIEVNFSMFCVGPANFPLVCNSPVTGTYNDIISSFGNDVIVGPPGGTEPDSVTQAYDPVLETGVGDFQIDPGSTPGSADVGELLVIYTLTDTDPNDPNSTPTFTTSNQTVMALASVTTTAASATPEPSTAALLAIALIGLSFLRRKLGGTRPCPNNAVSLGAVK